MVALGLKGNGYRMKMGSAAAVVSTEVITTVVLGLRYRGMEYLKVFGSTVMRALILVG